MTRRYLGLLGLVLLLSASGLLRADSLNSVAGLSGVCVYDAAGVNCTDLGTTTVAIGAHPLWQPNLPNAVWISYKDSGYLGTQFQDHKGDIPVFALTQTFSASDKETLTLRVWADDTAGVFLDNVQLKAPVFTQSICSGQAIGCLPKDAGIFANVPLTFTGTHTLRFDVYQVGTGTDTASNPMGLLYTGNVSDGGMTLMLLGGALVGLEALRRKFRA